MSSKQLQKIAQAKFGSSLVALNQKSSKTPKTAELKS